MYAIWRTNKRTVLYSCAGVVISFFLLSVWMSHHVEASDSIHLHNNRYVNVMVGQSLWSIAKQIAKPNEDIRDVVYEICILNHLSSPNITPGMQLMLPADR